MCLHERKEFARAGQARKPQTSSIVQDNRELSVFLLKEKVSAVTGPPLGWTSNLSYETETSRESKSIKEI